MLSAFFGMTANLDENVGRLVKFLDERGLSKNMILIYMTDKGSVERTGFYNAGRRGRKASLYDGGHRVRWSQPQATAGGSRGSSSRSQGRRPIRPDV